MTKKSLQKNHEKISVQSAEKNNLKLPVLRLLTQFSFKSAQKMKSIFCLILLSIFLSLAFGYPMEEATEEPCSEHPPSESSNCICTCPSKCSCGCGCCGVDYRVDILPPIMIPGPPGELLRYVTLHYKMTFLQLEWVDTLFHHFLAVL